MLGDWIYLAIGIALLVGHRRLGAFVYRLRVWPNPVHRRRIQVQGALPPEHITGERRSQLVFVALGLAFAALSIVDLVRS